MSTKQRRDPKDYHWAWASIRCRPFPVMYGFNAMVHQNGLAFMECVRVCCRPEQQWQEIPGLAEQLLSLRRWPR